MEVALGILPGSSAPQVVVPQAVPRVEAALEPHQVDVAGLHGWVGCQGRGREGRVSAGKLVGPSLRLGVAEDEEEVHLWPSRQRRASW